MDGKLTRILIRWPDADSLLRPIRNDIRTALYNREEVLEWELMLRDVKGRAMAIMVNYQDFEEDLYPTLAKMSQL